MQDSSPKEEKKETPAPSRIPGFGEYTQKDEYLDVLTKIDPDHFKIQDIDAPEDENAAEVKTVNYYYPKKIEEYPPIIDAETSDERSVDHEIELLHSFFPSNGISSAIDDAKHFLIANKFVTDEGDIDVVRGPFTQYEIKCLENEEFHYDNPEPNVVYIKEKQDEEINEIADLLPAKTEIPEGAVNRQQPPQQPPQQQRVPQPGAPVQVEDSKKPNELKLPYEKQSRDLPCLLSVRPKQIISIDELIAQIYTSDSSLPERKSRKRLRDTEEESKLTFLTEDQITTSPGTEVKKSKIEEVDTSMIEITEEDSDTRKKAFKTY